MEPPPDLADRLIREREGKRLGDGEIRFKCPFPAKHNRGDADPSARYNPQKCVWCCDACREGGNWRHLCEHLGYSFGSETATGSGVAEARRRAGEYVYRAESGEPLRRKVRIEPGYGDRSKSFFWEQPDGQGGWKKARGDGNPTTLYHSEALQETREAGGRVLVVEGEKDADCADSLGFLAVSNPEGAGAWRAEYSEQLKGLHVVVVPDLDKPGWQHARKVAASLHGVAQSVRLLELPGDGKDLSDFAAPAARDGLGAEEIQRRLADLLAEAPEWCPDARSVAEVVEPDPIAGLFSALEDLDPNADLAEVEELLRELGRAVEGRDDLARQVVRERAIRALGGKVKAPGAMVDAAMTLTGRGTTEVPPAGRPLFVEDPEPWPEPVNGAALLDELEAIFSRFLVLPEGAATALALWTVHTYAHESASISPLLALTSPEKRCGKTTGLALLGSLVRRPMSASNITPAALFRAVERYGPTLLIDEADTFLRDREELLGILNSGHTRGGAYVVRSVGDDHEPRHFSTWAPKAIAKIGRLPTTLEDRSIGIPMKRKAPGEKVERLRLDRLPEFGDYRRRGLRWALDREPKLSQADPEVPAGLHDRAADNWRPLLAIADAAGGGVWPTKARAAARLLSASEGGDSSAGVELLADVRAVFEAEGTARLFTETLLAALLDDESKPWGEWSRGKPLTPHKLARLLKPLGVAPRKIRIGEETRQGYRAEDLADALARYLPAGPAPLSGPEHPEHLNDDGTFRRFQSRNNEARVPAGEATKRATTTGVVPDVPDSTGQ